MITSRGT